MKNGRFAERPGRVGLTGRFIAAAIYSLGFCPVSMAGEKLILGWVEKVSIPAEAKLTLEAKLDTGADTSSLDAKVLKRFRRDGKHWLRFSVRDPATKESVILERPHLRGVRIKRHDGKHQRREVADLPICLGDRLHTIEVTLINREQFEYPLLLGRSALKGFALVDPGLKRTQNPRCAQAQSAQKMQVDGERAALGQAQNASAHVTIKH